MIPIITLIVVVILSMAVIRIATTALVLTGISEPLARFQARSAYTGAGFTTSESEKVVQHPVRRRIIMLLMLLGNAGIVTAVSSLMLSFMNVQSTDWMSTAIRMALLLSALTVIWIISSSSWLDHQIHQVIGKALTQFSTLEARDYAGLLHLTGDYVVAELSVRSDDWLADRPLKDLALPGEGVLILGVERPNEGYLGAPRGEFQLHEGDTIIVYGRQPAIEKLDSRRKGSQGNRQHVSAVADQIESNQAETDDSKGSL